MKCPNCNGRMIKIPDDLKRMWWDCVDCHIRIPVKWGYTIIKDGKTIH